MDRFRTGRLVMKSSREGRGRGEGTGGGCCTFSFHLFNLGFCHEQFVELLYHRQNLLERELNLNESTVSYNDFYTLFLHARQGFLSTILRLLG
jgi:hypothetical protein